MSGELEITRRRLPHWTMTGSTYVVTWRLAAGVAVLSPAERAVTVECLMHFHDVRYRLLAYAVMDDHVHAVVRPLSDTALSRIIHTWKSFTATRINGLRDRKGVLWLDESYDRLIRDENEFLQKLEYVITNPVRRWPEAKDYEWVGWFANE